MSVVPNEPTLTFDCDANVAGQASRSRDSSPRPHAHHPATLSPAGDSTRGYSERSFTEWSHGSSKEEVHTTGCRGHTRSLTLPG